MNASVIKDGIDRVETGLPAQPDLGRVLARGRRLRRRRRAGIGVGVAALVAAVAVPVGLLAGGDSPPDLAPDPAASSTPAPAAEFGPAFGDAMSATVTALLPDATRVANSQRDHYEPNGACCTRPAVNDPVDYAHVFSWSQAFDLPSGATLFVNSMQYPAPLMGGTPSCRPDEKQPNMTCDVAPTGDGRTLAWTQGLKYDDPPNTWGTSASVTSDAAGPHGMRSTVSVSVSVEAGSWPEAQAAFPDLEALTRLASDATLVIPEPETLPGLKVGNFSYPALP
jgi:hypothetical protein